MHPTGKPRSRVNGRAQQEFSRRVLARARHRCEVRGEGCLDIATEADHIIPLSQGGTHDLKNGRAVCKVCHRRFTNEQIRFGKNRWKRKTMFHPSDFV